jgi:hypothetical protein
LILSDHELTNTLIRTALQLCLMFVSCLIDRCVGIERGRDHPLRLAIKGGGDQNSSPRAHEYPFANFVRKSSCSGCTANDINRKQFVRNFDQRDRTLV